MPSMPQAIAGATALALLLAIAPALAQQTTPPPLESTTPLGSTTPPAATTAPGAASNASPTAEQPSSLTKAEAKPQFMPPGMMMGPATTNPYTAGRECDPRSAGFSGWRIARLESALDLNEDQKKKLEDYKTASAKALDGMVSTCSDKAALTPAGQLEAMEKRLTAQLDAVKAMRTAFDPFYSSLTDEQKARLTADARGRGWRWEVGNNRRW